MFEFSWAVFWAALAALAAWALLKAVFDIVLDVCSWFVGPEYVQREHGFLSGIWAELLCSRIPPKRLQELQRLQPGEPGYPLPKTAAQLDKLQG